MLVSLTARLLNAMVAVSNVAAMGDGVPDKIQCGPLALYFCAATLRDDFAYRTITESLPEKADDYTLAELKTAGDAMGFAVRGLRWLDGLPKCPIGHAPAIIPVQLPDGSPHFIACLESLGDKLLIIDFPAAPGWTTVDDLRNRFQWDGSALHIASDGRSIDALLPPGRLMKLRWLLPAGLFLVSWVLWPSQKYPRSAIGKLGRYRFRTNRQNSMRAGLTSVELLVSIAVVSLLLAISLPAIQSARERSRQIHCLNNLKQISQACHGYESAHKHFPSYLLTDTHAQGLVENPRNLSVQAQLLPYLDMQSLFDRIDRQEDGDGLTTDPPGSARNADVLHAPVPVFLCPSDIAVPGAINYRGCSGTTPGIHSTIPESESNAAQRGIFVRFNGVRTGMVTDGLSQTAMFGERLLGDRNPAVLTAARDIADMDRIPPGDWPALRPGDVYANCVNVTRTDMPHWSFAGSTWLLGDYTQTLYNHILPPNSAIPDCGTGANGVNGFHGAVSVRSYHPGGVNIAFADGAVKFVSESIDLSIWRALGSIRGEEVISEF